MNKIVDDALRLNLESVVFSGGGEPLANKYTLLTIEKIFDSKLNTKTALNTNGYLLEDASKIDYLRVSVDAGTKKTYKNIHGVDGFERVTENIKNSNHNELGLAFLISNDNWFELEEFCEWAQQFNYTFLHIRPAWLDAEYMHGAKELKEKMHEIEQIGDSLQKMYRDIYFKVDKFDGYWTPKLYSKCRASVLKAVINADGKFSVCQDNFIKFGDYNTQDFDDIWFSEDHYDAIDKIKLEECPRCVEAGYNEILENCFVEDNLRWKLV